MMAKIRQSYSGKMKGMWYVHNGLSENGLYLHTDGIWRKTTYCNKTKKFSGYYPTQAKARNMLKK